MQKLAAFAIVVAVLLAGCTSGNGNQKSDFNPSLGISASSNNWEVTVSASAMSDAEYETTYGQAKSASLDKDSTIMIIEFSVRNTASEARVAQLLSLSVTVDGKQKQLMQYAGDNIYVPLSSTVEPGSTFTGKLVAGYLNSAQSVKISYDFGDGKKAAWVVK